MSVLSDKQIHDLCINNTGSSPLIDPFVNGQIKENEKGEKIVSYGLSSFGYDLRLGRKFKIFTNVNNSIIDPKNFTEDSFVDFEGDVCIIPPNSFVLAYSEERIALPRNVVGIVLGKSTYARCFTGDTKVALVNGTSVSFKDMVERYKKGERFWGYSVDERTRVVVSELTIPRLIGREKVIEIELDNGEKIKATKDHKFMLLDGTYKQAKDLVEGASLMPLYRTVTRGYEAVVQPHSYAMTSTHYLSDIWNLENGVYTANENEHRHHKDHDKRNNYPGNIVRVNASTHISEHNKQMWANDEIRNKILETRSLNMKKIMADPVSYQILKDGLQKMVRKLWDDPSLEKSRQAIITAAQNRFKNMTPEEKEAMAERMRKLHTNEEFARERDERIAAMWRDPEYREMMREKASLLNRREDITELEVENAFKTAGSIRGAARFLNCDRTVFRRFKEIVLKYKEIFSIERISMDDMLKHLQEHGSLRKTAKALGISRNTITRNYQDAVKLFYGTEIHENHKVVSIREVEGEHEVYCLTVPVHGNFALEAGVFVSNCGISCLATPLEPEWEGHVTLEFANTTPLPAMLYAGEGSCQVVFLQGEDCLVSYKDRNGKYNNQEAKPVIPKV